MAIVIEPPEGRPLEQPKDDGSNLWERLYESLGFHISADEATGFDLMKTVQSLCSPSQPVYDLVRERDGRVPWEILLDPAECPAEWLPYQSQYVGVIPTPEMTEQQLRAENSQPTGWKRGEPEALRTATRRTLKPVVEGEELWVIIRPRTPEPGHHYIRTLLGQTPEPERTKRVIRENLAAWEMLDYEAIAGVSWTDIADGWKSWEELEEDISGWLAVAELLPDELPE